MKNLIIALCLAMVFIACEKEERIDSGIIVNYNDSLFLACKNNDIDLLFKCRDIGVNLNQTNQFKQTPLIVATINNSYRSVSFLLSYPLDTKAIDVYNKSAIQYAKELGYFNIEDLILEYEKLD